MISIPNSHVAADRNESQVKVRMQQQKKLRKRLELGGARAATQWYWPPAVGYLNNRMVSLTTTVAFRVPSTAIEESNVGRGKDTYFLIFSAKDI